MTPAWDDFFVERWIVYVDNEAGKRIVLEWGATKEELAARLLFYPIEVRRILPKAIKERIWWTHVVREVEVITRVSMEELGVA